MSEPRDYLELTFRSIQCFADDGRLDLGELDSLVAIAERDGAIDDNERRVLKNIIGRIKPDEIDQPMRERLAEIEQKLSA